MEHKYTVKKFLLMMLLFLLMYRPSIVGVSANYYFIFILFFSFVFFKKIQIYNNYIKKILLPLVLITVYIFLMVILKNGALEALIGNVNLFISLFIVMELFISPFSRKNITCNVLNWIISIGCFQSFLCILMKISPTFYDLFSIEAQYITSIDFNRNYGIAGSTEFLYGIGLVHGFIALILLDRFIKKKKLKDFILVIVMLIPCVLDTRTGILCFAVGAIPLLFDIKRLLMLLKRFIYLVPIIGIAIFLFIKVSVNNSFFLQFIEAVGALIFSKTDTKVYEWYGGLLPSNWIFPSGMDFLFGTGQFDNYNTYLISGVHDSGYYRMIYLGGVVLIILALYAVFKYISSSMVDSRLKKGILLFIILSVFKGNAFVISSFMCTVVLIVEYFNHKYRRELDEYCGDNIKVQA